MDQTCRTCILNLVEPIGTFGSENGGRGPCGAVHAFSVCDDPDYFYDYVQGLLDGLEAGVDSRDIVNIQNVRELKFVTEIAATTGIVLDPVYSGKAAYGMLKDMAENAKKWEGRKILFIQRVEPKRSILFGCR
ncbi:unnamed protein product [Prunus armeniaca]|uniref:Uncharacterized protein n=1 Tax=Prunus armeniaca TaxID=36596 RepID=A0A6J5V4H3_PRUAR|nr:unnamed protein product [Prunus armeniaca]